jgi:hypothetical protein
MQFAAGSMGPKVEAACRFASATGKRAAIGALADLGKIITGEAGYERIRQGRRDRLCWLTRAALLWRANRRSVAGARRDRSGADHRFSERSGIGPT